MSAIAFDVGVIGNWQMNKPAAAQRGAMAARVAYAVLDGGKVTHSDVLILRPSRSINFIPWNLQVGGMTWDGVLAEGELAADLLRHDFWTHLEQADAALCFCKAFHIDALNSFAHEVGVDLTGRGPRKVVDLMLSVDELVGAKNKEGRPKVPSLTEASNAMLGGDIEADRAEARFSETPIRAFALVQIMAVVGLALDLRQRRHDAAPR